MTTANKIIYGLDASKYPARLGQPWRDTEALKLLTSIQKKKSIETIAMEHERTVGGIRAQINRMAVDYHFNDQRPMEEIQKYTGLTKEAIEDAIRRQEVRNSIAEQKKQSNKKVSSNNTTFASSDNKKDEPTMKEMFSMLKDIQQKLTILLERQ